MLDRVTGHGGRGAYGARRELELLAPWLVARLPEYSYRGARELARRLDGGPLVCDAAKAGPHGGVFRRRDTPWGHGGLLRWTTDEDGTRWPAGTRDELTADGVAGPRCPGLYRGKAVNGRWWCHRLAGEGTDHLGVGLCRWHARGGPHARARAAAEAGWILGHGFAGELNVTPWEALLTAVRIAARKVTYCEHVLAQAGSDRVLEVGHEGSPVGVGEDGQLLEGRSWTFWLEQSERWHDRMLRAAKAAVDAGVAEALVGQARAEAAQVAGVLTGVLEDPALALSEDQRSAFRAAARRELLALDAAERDVITGTVVGGAGGG